MRPRQACLGIRHGTAKQVVLTPCFNEAEASLPRNPEGNYVEGNYVEGLQ